MQIWGVCATSPPSGVQWWLQSKGPDTVRLLDEGGAPLAYALPEFGITMPFKPTDFTQVNPHINRVLVSRALRLLDVQRDERVIDWFCGLGNFTCLWRPRPGRCWALKAARPWWRGPARIMIKFGSKAEW